MVAANSDQKFNISQFNEGLLDGNIGSPTFGRILNASRSRRVQLGVRFFFQQAVSCCKGEVLYGAGYVRLMMNTVLSSIRSPSPLRLRTSSSLTACSSRALQRSFAL
jgi:hypothetical protein